MLMAILYCDDDRIGAAAPACDQVPYGDQFWNEIFPGDIEPGPLFETAYINVNNAALRERLLSIGIEDEADGKQLAKELVDSLIPTYMNRAA